jgi:hypothetical protein
MHPPFFALMLAMLVAAFATPLTALGLLVALGLFVLAPVPVVVTTPPDLTLATTAFTLR